MTTLHTCNKNDYLIFLFTFFLLQFTLIFFHQNFILIQSTIPKIYSITIYYINIFTNTTTWLYIYCENTLTSDIRILMNSTQAFDKNYIRWWFYLPPDTSWKDAGLCNRIRFVKPGNKLNLEIIQSSLYY